ncbi:beta-lactamase family protein [Leptodontidium sp. MPI-SDFR-AT-0119]|nr:beta-lactamase family protein [Leptodontidium sp. MPI-SDFR-AT-0119]
MQLSSRNLLLLSYLGGVCNCDFLGPRFPSPVDLSSDSSVVAAGWRNVSTAIDSYLNVDFNRTTRTSIGLENMTFSIGMFSIRDPAAKNLQYHHISVEAKAGPGTSEISGDSIYRVASVSKLFTVFASLLSFDCDQWDQSITNFIPGFSNYTLNSTGQDSVLRTKWEDVTLRSLASQVAGIPRDPSPFFSDVAIRPDLLTGHPTPNPATLGLPPLTLEEIEPFLPCLLNPDLAACSPASVFEANQARPPTFPAWTTPAYANNGFILLGIALANITGMPLADVYPELIFRPLGMTNSKSAAPPESEWSQYVVSGNDATYWAQQGGVSIGSGGIFSSLNDLAKFGTALMNSTLLPPARTREWMKPVSHTADLTFSVGAPWEIYRYEHAGTGAVTDIYTKLGDAGNYTAFVCLIPDYEAGFNVLTSSYISQRSALASTIADLITTTMIPSLEAQAAAEAAKNLAGTYASDNPSLNSSITISFNDSSIDSGLYITSFTSNGTDVMPLLPFISGGITTKLLPSIQESGQVAFRAVAGKVIYPPRTFLGPFLKMSTANSDWLIVDWLTYGGVGLSLFVFEVDADGRATGIEPAAMRMKLVRV